MALFKTREIQYASEASFCENAATPGSLTYTTRLPVAGDVTVTLDHPRVDADRVQSRLGESIPGYLGVKRCSIDIPVYWCGHGTAPTGALVETWLQDLLSDGLGGGNVAQVGGTIGVGSTATSLVYAAATAVKGAVWRVGSKNDGRADGQPTVLNGTATPVTTLTALPGAPNNADVVYATQMAYPTESLGATKRFLVGWTSMTAQYHLLGCQLAGLTFSLPVGGMPMVTLKYRGAYWVRSSVSIPSAVATAACDYAPITAGSVFINNVGTATRTTYSVSQVNFSVDLGLQEQVSPGGVQYQDIVGWERTACVPQLELRAPWTNFWDSTYDADGEAGTTHQHILVGLNSTSGRAVGFYLPRAYFVGPKPTVTPEGDLLYQTWVWRGREGTDVTNDLTRSNFRLFMG